MKTFKLVLTNENGEVLETWRVSVEQGSHEAFDLTKPLARTDLLEEIASEVRRAS